MREELKNVTVKLANVCDEYHNVTENLANVISELRAGRGEDQSHRAQSERRELQLKDELKDLMEQKEILVKEKEGLVNMLEDAEKDAESSKRARADETQHEMDVEKDLIMQRLTAAEDDKKRLQELQRKTSDDLTRATEELEKLQLVHGDANKAKEDLKDMRKKVRKALRNAKDASRQLVDKKDELKRMKGEVRGAERWRETQKQIDEQTMKGMLEPSEELLEIACKEQQDRFLTSEVERMLISSRLSTKSFKRVR